MDRIRGPETALTLALHRGLYVAILIDLYIWPQTALTIALHCGILLAIIMVRYG
jgi:hypothetical protein